MSTLAHEFASKYNKMTDAEKFIAFGLEMKAYSSDEHNGFEFADGSRVEFSTSEEQEVTGCEMIAYKPQPNVNIQTVLNAIMANNNNPKVVIDRFSLAKKITKYFENGLVKAGYYLHGKLVFELTE